MLTLLRFSLPLIFVGSVVGLVLQRRGGGCLRPGPFHRLPCDWLWHCGADPAPSGREGRMMVARIQRTAGLGKTPPGAGYPSRTICPVIFTICIPTARRSGTIASGGHCSGHGSKKECFVAQIPNAPTPGRDPLHDPPEPPARDPPTEPLHDPPGDPTHEPPQPRTDPTPNPASDPPRELPSGVAWC